MVTEFVSSDGVAISLADGETEDIRDMVRLCLRSAGLRPWGDMEAELFESGSGCLLLARPRSPRQQRGTYRRHTRH